MCKFSESTKQKLGNAIVYIACHTSGLSKTKLLKLLYLMEERMTLKYHVPFIGIPFEIRRELCGIGRLPVPDCWKLLISMNAIILTSRSTLRRQCLIVRQRIIAKV